MKPFLKILGVIPLVVVCSGCATIMAGTDQEVTFKSEPEGADVQVVCTRNKRVYTTVTPNTLNICKRSDYLVTFSHEGYHTESHALPRVVGAAALGSGAGNALIGGIPGVLVDGISGASSNFWPELEAHLTPLSDPPPPNGGHAEDWQEKPRYKQLKAMELAARKAEKQQDIIEGKTKPIQRGGVR